MASCNDKGVIIAVVYMVMKVACLKRGDIKIGAEELAQGCVGIIPVFKDKESARAIFTDDKLVGVELGVS